MVGEAVQQSPGQAFRAEYLRPLIERQVAGHQDRAPLVALAEDFEQQLGAGLRERHEAEFVDDQKVILCQLLRKRLVWLPCLRPQMSDSVHDR